MLLYGCITFWISFNLKFQIWCSSTLKSKQGRAKQFPASECDSNSYKIGVPQSQIRGNKKENKIEKAVEMNLSLYKQPRVDSLSFAQILPAGFVLLFPPTIIFLSKFRESCVCNRKRAGLGGHFLRKVIPNFENLCAVEA